MDGLGVYEFGTRPTYRGVNHMDYYFSASTEEALISALAEPNPPPVHRFQVGFQTVVAPTRGRAAVEESQDEFGNTIPAQPAIGDPDKWYCCIRSTEIITPPEGIEAVPPEVGAAVCGIVY